jgi:hypothetical protein
MDSVNFGPVGFCSPLLIVLYCAFVVCDPFEVHLASSRYQELS